LLLSVPQQTVPDPQSSGPSQYEAPVQLLPSCWHAELQPLPLLQLWQQNWLAAREQRLLPQSTLTPPQT
jgi:hypothetical protein